LAERHGAAVLVAAGHISAAVNRGWAAGGDRYRYVAWLGDDDILRPGALARSVRALDAEPRAVVAFGTCDYIDESGHLLFTRRPPAGAAALLQFVPGLIKQETCLFRLDAVRRVGWLDESSRYAMDLDLLLRLRRQGAFARVDEPQAGFCWHPNSLTIANRKASLDEAQRIQTRASRGLSRWLFAAARPLLRAMILIVASRINKSGLRQGAE
jgi:GT2 family glycosyltransferase